MQVPESESESESESLWHGPIRAWHCTQLLSHTNTNNVENTGAAAANFSWGGEARQCVCEESTCNGLYVRALKAGRP